MVCKSMWHHVNIRLFQVFALELSFFYNHALDFSFYFVCIRHFFQNGDLVSFQLLHSFVVISFFLPFLLQFLLP